MATIEDFQRDLSNPALVTTFVSQAPTKMLTVTKQDPKTKLTKTMQVKVVTTPPETLAKQIGEPVDVVSLARLLKSEGYSGPVSQKARALVAIGQAVINHATTLGKSVTDTLTRSIFAGANGLYGEQSGRYAATTQDPRPYHIKLAKALLNRELPDIVSGGEYFLDPWGPGATQAGKPLQPFEDVLRTWHEVYKYVRIPIPGITEDALMVFKPSSDSQAREHSLIASIQAWKRAFSNREPSEGRIGAEPSGPIVESKVSFTEPDYIKQLMALFNFAERRYGRADFEASPGDVGNKMPRMSGLFLRQMTAYWAIQMALWEKAGVGKFIPDSAIVTKWKRETQEFADMFPVYTKEAKRVGNDSDRALVDPVISTTFWRQLFNVVTPLSGIQATPTVLTLVIQSIKEAVQDLNPIKPAGEGLKLLAKIGVAVGAGFLAIQILKE